MTYQKIDLDKEIDYQIQWYLYNVFRCKNHYMERTDEIKDTFQIVNPPNTNPNREVVNAEAFLEGCTRVFLINPIFDLLFRYHGIDVEWRFGSTFSEFHITTREYESDAFIEFIVLYNEQKIGYRYTSSSINLDEPQEILQKNNEYVLQKKPIPGFNSLSPVDKAYVISWTTKEPEGQDQNTIPEISLKTFFNTYFPDNNFESFIDKLSTAIKNAKSIIGVTAIKELNRENLYTFKQNVLSDLSSETMKNMKYDYSSGTPIGQLSEDDIHIINDKVYMDNNLLKALIGKAGFAKCFITSEYLFSSLKNDLSIDYTAIISGYLKSVEQLLYIYYESAYMGKEKLMYWRWYKEKYNKEKKLLNKFDDSQSENYRYDPYEKKKQEKYSYSIRKNATIGDVIYFLRYYTDAWDISERGKEYVISCLNDYKSYSRNEYFHKGNLDSNSYEMVVKIRNNTIVCIRYILGAFRLLDQSKSIDDQLGVLDYSFEEFYNITKAKMFLHIKGKDGYDGIVYRSFCGSLNHYDTDGRIKDPELKFIKVDNLVHRIGEGIYEHDLDIDDYIQKNGQYINENTITFTRDNIPQVLKCMIRRKRKI